MDTRYQIDAETFIQIWLSSSTLEEVAERTGTLPASCSSRAMRFRRDFQIDLPRFRRGRPRKLGGGRVHKSYHGDGIGQTRDVPTEFQLP